MEGRTAGLLALLSVLIPSTLSGGVSESNMNYIEFLDLNTAPEYLPQEDDGVSGDISIPGGFPFGGGSTQYSVYVGTNGYFSFGSDYDRPPSITSFTRSSSVSYLVAPFWTDIDTRFGGEILYETHTTDNGSYSIGLLNQVSTVISDQIGESFSGSWMLVALWFQVAQISGGSEENTFQGIVITDGADSYAVFIYNCEKMEWSRSQTLIGFKTDTYFRNFYLTGSDANSVACLNSPTTVWTNVVYKLSSGDDCILNYGCNNGECIPYENQCDGNNDCGDNSDELYTCTCPGDQFRCNDGQCIPSDDRCDFITQCDDESDEDNCPCQSYQFECDNGECASQGECDDFEDCSDGSDEDGCVNLGLAIGLSTAGFIVFMFIAVPVCICCCAYCQRRNSGTISITTGLRSRVVRIRSVLRKQTNPPVTTAIFTSTTTEEHTPTVEFGIPPQGPPPPSAPTFASDFGSSAHEPPPPYPGYQPEPYPAQEAYNPGYNGTAGGAYPLHGYPTEQPQQPYPAYPASGYPADSKPGL